MLMMMMKMMMMVKMKMLLMMMMMMAINIGKLHMIIKDLFLNWGLSSATAKSRNSL